MLQVLSSASECYLDLCFAVAAVAADVVWRVPYLRSHLLINKPLWLSLFSWIQSILFPVEMIVSVVDISDYQVTISQSGFIMGRSHIQF